MKEALYFNFLTHETLPKNTIWKLIGNIAADARRKALRADYTKCQPKLKQGGRAPRGRVIRCPAALVAARPRALMGGPNAGREGAVSSRDRGTVQHRWGGDDTSGVVPYVGISETLPNRCELQMRGFAVSNEDKPVGAYGAAEALQLINFQRAPQASGRRKIARQTVVRWLYGYEHGEALWRPDFLPTEDAASLEVSFRDLIELRFVKTFRDAGLSLQTIRECFGRAVDVVHDERPFSTRRFRTDGKTIFFEITDDVREGELVDLKHRQSVFHRIVEPSLHDLEFDADVLARWFPLGISRKSIVVDPSRAFGRPIVSDGGVPTETIFRAVKADGSPERVAKLYELPIGSVCDAIAFQQQLAA